MPRLNLRPTALRRLILSCAVLAISFFAFGCGKGEFSSLEDLPVDSYLKKPGDFLGNTYLLKARIDSQIKWREGVGRILAVRAEGENTRLPVFVPESGGPNMHVGQVYEMRAVIREGGLIYVEALRKY